MKLSKEAIEIATENGQAAFTVKSQFWANNEVYRHFLLPQPLILNRGDLFTEFEEGNTVLAILKTLAWGYPQAMRKFKPSKRNLGLIREILDVKNELTEADLYRVFGGLAQIEGIGPSTITKLLFFSDKRYDQMPCLILDERVFDAMKRFSDFNDLLKQPMHKGVAFYIQYIMKMDELAKSLSIDHERIEMYLYQQGKL